MPEEEFEGYYPIGTEDLEKMINVHENATTETDEKLIPLESKISTMTPDPTGTTSPPELSKDKAYEDPYHNRIPQRTDKTYAPHSSQSWLREPGFAKGHLDHKPSGYQNVQYDPNVQYGIHARHLRRLNRRHTLQTDNLNHSTQSRPPNQTPVFNNKTNNIQQTNDLNYYKRDNSYWKPHDNLRPEYHNRGNQFHNVSSNHWNNNYNSFSSQPPPPPLPPNWYRYQPEPPINPKINFKKISPNSNKFMREYCVPDFNIYDESPSKDSNNQSTLTQLPKHEFTGWAGYNWPTILKTTPKRADPEEENMRVYTKPSFTHNRTYNFDFINTADMERKENIQPGQQENIKPHDDKAI